jgi:chitodextrinase
MKARTLSNKFVAFLLLFSLLITSISPAIYAADGDPDTVYLVASSPTVQSGDNFTVQVRANTAPANAALVNLTFNSSDISYVGYSLTGSAYNQETGLSLGTGTFTNSLYLSGGTPDVYGDILLLTLTFTANVSTGTSIIDLLGDSCTVATGICISTMAEDETISFTAAPGDTVDPTAPSALTGTVSADKVDLSWGASTDNVAVDSYDVYRDGNPIGYSSTTTYTDSNVSPGQSYDYTVRAMDTSGNYSTASDVFTANLPQSSTPPTETTYSDDQPSTTIQVNQNEVAIVTGKRGDITIACGLLKGTGTVGDINMNCGRVAPGLSPGLLNSGDVTYTGGTFEAELGGTTPGNGDGNHDQLNVTGTVDLGSATALSVVHWNNFRPALNNQFVIINNDGSEAVVGTFQGLAQGATITVDGITYTISYTGGDGNDVVLTVTNVPTTPTPATPNTGIQMIKDYSLITLVTSILALASLVYIKKFSASKK